MNREYYPALRGRIGDWAYYSVLMSFKQAVINIKYAHEIHKSKKLSELIQRELDDKKRSGEIGTYLVSNQDRFFNSLVVAVYGGDPEWHEFQNLKPLSEDIDLSKINYNSRYSIGYLSFSGKENLFALDGQHRLAGIKDALKKNPDLENEEISVIFVSHHTDESGLRRTRKLFTTLNKTAKPVSKSEIIALDEADTMAITARGLIENYDPFKDKLIHVLSRQTNLPRNDNQHFLTIINLYDILELLFIKSKKKVKADDFKKTRQSDEQLKSHYEVSVKYFNLLAKSFPELKACFKSAAPSEEIKKYRLSNGGNILFRPIGIILFTSITATLMKNFNLSLEESVKELKHLPTDLTAEPYIGILWDNLTNTMLLKNKSLIKDLLLYYIGRLDSSATAKAIARYSLILNEAGKLPPTKPS